MSTSEHTAHRTYSSRRPHWVTLMSTNRKLWLQFSQAHQKWTTEDWKNVTSCEDSRFLPQPSGSFGIWCKGHESMDPSCLWSKVQAGAGWDVCSPIEHLCDVMRQKILLQDVQMMTATFFIPSCTTSFFKLLFWLSSILFNSSLVNSFKSNLCY